MSVSQLSVPELPLTQVTIKLQGSGLSDKEAIINQLKTVAERLRAGEIVGYDYDETFGYYFDVLSVPPTCTLFAPACGKR